MIQLTVAELNSDYYKIIDGSHIKVHQDACYDAESYEQHGFGQTKGGRNSKINAVTNGKGKLLDLVLIPGNQGETKSAMEALGELQDCIVLGDKGYDSDDLRAQIKKAGGIPNIPGRKNRKEEVFYIKKIGKIRHVVENYFCRIKRFRRVNTRYDRLPETFLSFICLASLMDWVR